MEIVRKYSVSIWRCPQPVENAIPRGGYSASCRVCPAFLDTLSRGRGHTVSPWRSRPVPRALMLAGTFPGRGARAADRGWAVIGRRRGIPRGARSSGGAERGAGVLVLTWRPAGVWLFAGESGAAAAGAEPGMHGWRQGGRPDACDRRRGCNGPAVRERARAEAGDRRERFPRSRASAAERSAARSAQCATRAHARCRPAIGGRARDGAAERRARDAMIFAARDMRRSRLPLWRGSGRKPAPGVLLRSEDTARLRGD